MILCDLAEQPTEKVAVLGQPVVAMEEVAEMPVAGGKYLHFLVV